MACMKTDQQANTPVECCAARVPAAHELTVSSQNLVSDSTCNALAKVWVKLHGLLYTHALPILITYFRIRLTMSAFGWAKP